jgi:hypothetical protein
LIQKAQLRIQKALDQKRIQREKEEKDLKSIRQRALKVKEYKTMEAVKETVELGIAD